MNFVARDVAALRILVDKLIDNHHLAAKFFEELAVGLGKSPDHRQYGIKLAANLPKEGLEFLEVLGESAKMVSHDNVWESFAATRK